MRMRDYQIIMQLSDCYEIKMYFCNALGPAGPIWSLFKVFCFCFAEFLKNSTTTKKPSVRPKPNACERCICDPKRVYNIPFRMASVYMVRWLKVSRISVRTLFPIAAVMRFFCTAWSIPHKRRFFSWLTIEL